MPIANLHASEHISYITSNTPKIKSPSFDEYSRLCSKRFSESIGLTQAPQVHHAVNRLLIDKGPVKDASMLHAIRLTMETNVIENVVIDPPKVNLFRTENIYSRQYIACMHDQIQPKLDMVLRRYEDQLQCKYQSKHQSMATGINLACKIYIDILAIQPFKTKNEEIAAIMLVYTIYRAGFPFIITLDNGTAKSDETFQRCVENAKLCPDQPVCMTELRTFVLQACLLTLANYQSIRIDKD